MDREAASSDQKEGRARTRSHVAPVSSGIVVRRGCVCVVCGQVTD